MHKDLIDLIASYKRGPNRLDKNSLTEQFCELCFSGVADLGPAELEHVFGILHALIGDIEQHIHSKLAAFLSVRDDVPHDLLLLLANDDIEVAYDILVTRNLLTDGDLIEIIVNKAQQQHLAITKRETLSSDVSRTLVQTADCAVIESLLQNEGAELGDDLLGGLVESCGNNSDYRAALARRHDLPTSLATRLYCWISDAMREYVADRYELEPAVLADAITSALNEAMQEGIDGGPDPSALTEFASAEPKSDPGPLLKFLQSGVIFRFEQYFAKLASLPPSATTRALYNSGSEGLAIACKGIDLSSEMFSEIYWQLHGGQSYSVFRASHKYQAAMTFFDRIEPAGARAVLAAWREAPPEI